MSEAHRRRGIRIASVPVVAALSQVRVLDTQQDGVDQRDDLPGPDG
jgi:hypothetical protein